MDIAAWLRGLGLEQYEQAFRDNGIDAEILPKLTVEDLKDLGIARVGDRRKLLEAIAALREGTARHSPVLAPPTLTLWSKSEGDHNSDQEADADRHYLTEWRFRVRRSAA